MNSYNNDASGYVDFQMNKMKLERDQAEADRQDKEDATRKALGLSEAELRLVFGSTSQPLLANRLALSNLPLYRAIKKGIFQNSRSTSIRVRAALHGIART